jgi:hypothetical protein
MTTEIDDNDRYEKRVKVLHRKKQLAIAATPYKYDIDIMDKTLTVMYVESLEDLKILCSNDYGDIREVDIDGVIYPSWVFCSTMIDDYALEYVEVCGFDSFMDGINLIQNHVKNNSK